MAVTIITRATAMPVATVQLGLNAAPPSGETGVVKGVRSSKFEELRGANTTLVPEINAGQLPRNQYPHTVRLCPRARDHKCGFFEREVVELGQENLCPNKLLEGRESALGGAPDLPGIIALTLKRVLNPTS